MTEPYLQDDDFHRQIDLGLWRRILGHARAYWPQLIGLAGSGAVMAAVDTMFPLITGMLIDRAIEEGVGRTVYILGAAYLALIVVLTACIGCFITLAGKAATGIARDLRNRTFAQLQLLSFSYYDTHPVGWLVTRMTSDVTKLSSLIPWFMLDFVWGTSLLLAIAGMMFFLNWTLALAVLVIVPPLAVASVIFQRKLLLSSRRMRQTNSQITSGFNESITGVRTTKALTREPDNLDEFQVLTGGMYRWSMRNALQSAVYLPIVITLGSLGVGLALWQGGVRVQSGEISIGVLIAFMQYAALFSMPIRELAERFTDVQAAQAAAERIQTLLDTEPDIQESEEARRAIAQQQRDAVPGRASDGGDPIIETIEFRSVDFWYKPDEPVLKGFNLRVEAGQTVALVGPTGGGKSTIVNLAARFYEPTAGEILINGIDYRRRSLHWLQSNLGMVLQTPTLFSGSVRDNIHYGRLDATNAEIEHAARLVNAHDFIVDMPNGYDTDVGEGGGALSTGQRQLIALARAVLADPQIFIMDEATSSVDTETERLIQEAVNTVLAGRIAFVIAHRLSTIRAADTILVIEQGQIIEQGNHHSLLAQRGRYHALYTRQFVGEQADAAYAATSSDS